MAKESKSYFSHDANARNSDKLIKLRMKHKAAGYGVYFMLLERLREAKSYMSVKDYNLIAFDLREDANLIKSVIEDFGLFVFTEDGKYFYSEGFLERMKLKDAISQKRSESGKNGINKRWEKENSIANAMKDDSKRIANAIENDSKRIANATENDSKESKVKKRKEEKEISKEKRFSPPTVEMVSEYITEKGYNIDPEYFVSYYTAKDWMIGKNRMKDWHAACVTWNKNDYHNGHNNPTRTSSSQRAQEAAKLVAQLAAEDDNRTDN